MNLGDASSMDIDEDLHSRKCAVYGRETICRLFDARILMPRMQGLGAEIVNNLILAGIKSVTLRDVYDLSSSFVFAEQQDNEYHAQVPNKKERKSLSLSLSEGSPVQNFPSTLHLYRHH
ncbi:unnamed protein product [Vicia faba]|uniref:Uncharacterized protein n=1 Tax=Vicia faba TaxID=3906 RepID=A0AAV1A1U3_VICFA|nr:unnamed protein product [Vicia faba]